MALLFFIQAQSGTLGSLLRVFCLKGACSRGSHCSWAHDPEFKGRTDLVPTCPHLAPEGKCPLKNCYYRHPTASGAATLPAILPTYLTLPSKERAGAAVHDTLAYDMAEINLDSALRDH